MRDGGRIAAAVEVLTDIIDRRRPARLALKAWGDSARYAGAKDRAFVSGLVLDGLRRRRSLAWAVGDDSHAAVCIAAVRLVWGWSAERLTAALAEPHAPSGVSADIVHRLEAPRPLEAAPAPVQGDYPDWAESELVRAFGEDRVRRLQALARRAPVDLRVNTLKADRGKVLKALAPFHPIPLEPLETALRVPAPEAAERAPPIEVAPEFELGWFEVQDLGSQIAAASAGDIAGQQVLDFCAGGGGKTLALAAAMRGRGQLYAYDSDARRLIDTVRRAQRAGVLNLQVRSPIHKGVLDDLVGRMDLVFVDAPCTGSGVWRRHPDTKWRLSPDQLHKRTQEQDRVLRQAAAFLRPGGRLIYVTCSLFPSENEDRIAAFLAERSDFQAQTPFSRLDAADSGCDGFFFAGLRLGA